MTINSKLDAIATAIASIGTGGGTGAPAILTSIAADVTAIKNEIGISGGTTPPTGTVPVVSILSPASGPIAGGTSVTVNGTGLTGATAVNFGTTPGTNLTVTGDTSLTVVSPSLPAGISDVTVVTPAGTSIAAIASQFTAS